MEQRLESKFQEIITELHSPSRGVGPGDFAHAQSNEHRDACLQGNKAYTVDQGPGGITVFMPWRLHKPLQDAFDALAPRGLLHVSVFDQLVDDAEMFPKFQSKRKRDDIMHYIYRRTATVTDQGTNPAVENQSEDSNSYTGLLDFEAFLHSLFLLAKYRAAMLKSTQQSSFNQVVFRILELKADTPKAATSSFAKLRLLPNKKPPEYGDATPCRLVESSIQAPTVDTTSAAQPTLDSFGNKTRGEADTGNDTDDAVAVVVKSNKPQATATISSQEHTCTLDSTTRLNESTSIEPPAGKTGAVKEAKVIKTVDVGTTPLTGAESFDRIRDANALSNEKYESIMQELLQLQVEVSNKEHLHDELIKANAEIHRCNQELQYTRTELQKKIDELGQLSSEKDRIEESLQGEIKSLQTELESLQGHLHLKHEVQKLTTLQAHHEAKLFSIFLLYRQPQLHLGEFYMSERDCAHFCVDFDLWQTVELEDGTQVPMGKVAYHKVAEEAIDGSIFYWLFKAYLLEMSQMLTPDLDPSLSFSQMLLDDIFPKCEGNGGGGGGQQPGDIQVQDGQVYIDDVAHFSPWDPLPDDADDGNSLQHQPAQGRRQNDQTETIEVQGRLWFEPPEEKQEPSVQEYSTTPRFPYLG